jgi:hypothetical protein
LLLRPRRLQKLRRKHWIWLHALHRLRATMHLRSVK